jgi:hypothetical protein
VPPAAPKKKKRGVLVAVAVVVALVVAGGGAFALLKMKGGGGGASTPEDAAAALLNDTETLLADIASLDLTKAASHIAPSERTLFEAVAEASTKAGQDNAQSEEVKAALAAAQSAVTITFEDLEFSTEPLVDGVERTALTGGTVNLDADVEKLAGAIMDIYDSQPSLAVMADESISQSDLEDQLDSFFPVSKAADDLAELAGLDELFLVTVQEEDQWFVSLSMTMAQYAYEEAGYDIDDLGDLIPESEMRGASSADEALGNFVDALDEAASSGDIRELAKALPTAESRVFAVYGPALTDENPYFLEGLGGALEDLTGSKTSEIGGHARITLDGFTVPGVAEFKRDGDTWTLSIESYGETIEITLSQEVGKTWSLDFEQRGEYSDMSVTGSISIPSKGVIEGEFSGDGMSADFGYEGGCFSYDVMGESDEVCGDELGVDLSATGLDDWDKLPDLKNILALSAVKGAGGQWYISPTASLLDWAAALVQ